MHDAPNPETRRKAALDILRLGGFEPASVATYVLGIGPETPEGVQQQWERDEYFRQLASKT